MLRNVLFLLNLCFCDVYLKDYNPPVDTNTDASPAIQDAVNDALLLKEPLVFPPGLREFRLDSQIIISLGRKTPYFVLRGNESKLFPNFEGAGVWIKPLTRIEDAGSGDEVAHFEIHDLNFDGYFSKNFKDTRALKIGRNGYALSDFKQSVMRNSIISGFIKKSPVYITGSLTRHINFEHVVSRSNGWEIDSNQKNGFIGDMIFDACEAVYEKGGDSTLNFKVSGGAQLRGIHFRDCVFYGGKLIFKSFANGQLADIWATDCAIDQGVENTRGIDILGLGGQVLQIFIRNIYIVGFTNTLVNIHLDTESKKTSGMLAISGGQLNYSTTASAISVTNGVDTHIRDVNFRDIKGENCVSFENTAGSSISGCSYTGKKLDTFLNIGYNSDIIYNNNIGGAIKDVNITPLLLPVRNRRPSLNFF